MAHSAEVSGNSDGAPQAAPSLIAVDWGTTSFRAYLATADGRSLDQFQSPRGILSVTNGDFANVLLAAVGPWLARHGDLPVLMSGMIGSRQGWRDVAYLACPAKVADLAAALHPIAVTGISRAAIVPGLVLSGGGRMPDVMRGEETQVAGAMQRLGLLGGTFLLPGTHSKWVKVENGAIADFRTYMTGEVFGALKGHTILGRLMSDVGGTGGGFLKGLEAARLASGAPGALLHDIFSARTCGLMGEMEAGDLSDYLSGLLIGAEIRDGAGNAAEVVIIASDALAERYRRATRHFAVDGRIAPADCAVAGLAAIAGAALWI